MIAQEKFRFPRPYICLVYLNSHKVKYPRLLKGLSGGGDFGTELWRRELKSPQPGREVVPKKPSVADHYEIVTSRFGFQA
jgi:hypothetical protein